MASITSIHLPRSRSAVLHSLFRGRKFLKLLKRLTVDQAVPEIPLSVGSKLELQSISQSFTNFPYTSLYTREFVRLSCIYDIYTCICYIRSLGRLISSWLYICMTEAPTVLHFNALIAVLIDNHLLASILFLPI